MPYCEAVYFNERMADATAKGLKTQFREVMVSQPIGDGDSMELKDIFGVPSVCVGSNGDETVHECPYGSAGDYLCILEGSITMPWSESRMTAEVTAIRAEQLHDITEQEAVDSGYESRDDFLYSWKDWGGDDFYNANPWVWVIEFKPHFCNVDQLLEECKNG